VLMAVGVMFPCLLCLRSDMYICQPKSRASNLFKFKCDAHDTA
jgi:hypothetical protein